MSESVFKMPRPVKVTDTDGTVKTYPSIANCVKELNTNHTRIVNWIELGIPVRSPNSRMYGFLFEWGPDYVTYMKQQCYAKLQAFAQESSNQFDHDRRK